MPILFNDYNMAIVQLLALDKHQSHQTGSTCINTALKNIIVLKFSMLSYAINNTTNDVIFKLFKQ